jgi:hypothetical protein
MIRIAAVIVALLCCAAESQAQFFQPFGGRFRSQPCQPYTTPYQTPYTYQGTLDGQPGTFYNYYGQLYFYPSVQPYQTVPMQTTPVVPQPQVVPSPTQPELPKAKVTEEREPRPDPNPAKVAQPKDTGPKITQPPKRNEK